MAGRYSKRALIVGAKSHYQKANYYDLRYRHRTNDVRFYVEMIGKRPKQILELGAGTGRVSLALAKAGHEVWAVDREADMLDKLHQKCAKLSRDVRERVHVVARDIQRLDLKRRFDFVIAPFNVWMHFYSLKEVENAFGAVKRHLRKDGEFIFDVLMPNTWMMSRDPRRTYRCGYAHLPGDKARYLYNESFDYDDLSQTMWTCLQFQHPKQSAIRQMSPLAQRYFFPLELEALLHYNGFLVVKSYGDFDRRALESDSPSIVLVTKEK